jgi:hypothetical protein
MLGGATALDGLVELTNLFNPAAPPAECRIVHAEVGSIRFLLELAERIVDTPTIVDPVLEAAARAIDWFEKGVKVAAGTHFTAAANLLAVGGFIATLSRLEALPQLIERLFDKKMEAERGHGTFDPTTYGPLPAAALELVQLLERQPGRSLIEHMSRAAYDPNYSYKIVGPDGELDLAWVMGFARTYVNFSASSFRPELSTFPQMPVPTSIRLYVTVLSASGAGISTRKGYERIHNIYVSLGPDTRLLCSIHDRAFARLATDEGLKKLEGAVLDCDVIFKQLSPANNCTTLEVTKVRTYAFVGESIFVEPPERGRLSA